MRTNFKLTRRGAFHDARVPRTRGVLGSLGLVALLGGLCALAPAPPAHAQPNEFVVTSTLDEADVELPDDICDSDPGPGVRCTLRAAVMQANVTPGEHLIRLQPVLYRLTIPGANEDLGLSGDLDLVGRITIVGTSSGGRLRSTVDATGLNDRVFDGRSPAATLHGLTISGGALPTTTSPSSEFDGGGIRNGGILTVSDSVIRNNTAGRGGGVASRTNSPLTIERSTITDNSATAGDTPVFADGGGGIFLINSRFTLRDSTVQHNTSAFNGGGITIAPFFVSTPMRIERSLIVDNSAQSAGGGVFVSGLLGGLAVIENTTVSGNRAAVRGGGISAEDFQVGKQFVLRAATIAGNTAPAFAAGLYADFNTDVVATDVVFSNNLVGNCRVENSVVNGSSFSFTISTDSSCPAGHGNQPTISARLGPLQFNGGPTRTHALLEGSPAIDSGVSFAPIAVDQRGAFRFAEFRPGGNRFDIGAFESNAFGVGEFTMTAPPSVLVEQPVTLTASWVHPVRWRNLNTVELQLRSDEALAARVVYTEGITDTAGISVTDGLALYNSDGTIAGVGVAGDASVLESDTALLDLATTTLQGSGPEGKHVDLSLALKLKPNTAGRVYSTTVLASDDAGVVQGPHDTGRTAVGPFRSTLPLIAS